MPGPISVSGSPQAILRALVPAFRSELVELQVVAANKIADAARTFVPVRTGYLRSTIAVRMLRGELDFLVEVTAPYAYWVHFGTRRMPPRPFLYQAVEAVTPWYLNECRYLMERAVARAGAR